MSRNRVCCEEWGDPSHDRPGGSLRWDGEEWPSSRHRAQALRGDSDSGFLSPRVKFILRPLHCPFTPSARSPLLPQVAEFQETVAAQSQELAILQRSLEDKAAQVEVERMGAKVRVGHSQGLREAWEPRSVGQGPGEGTLPLLSPSQSLQVELSRAQEACRRGQQQTTSAEEQLNRVAKAINRCLV